MKGATVIFILRIANLYHGDCDGGKEAITENRALWFHHLITNGIGHVYSPRIIYIAEWNEQIKLALAKCLEQMLLRSQSISVL